MRTDRFDPPVHHDDVLVTEGPTRAIEEDSGADDGRSFSSLSHLLELPVDGVKIDRRFVAGIDVDPAATNLTTAIIGLSDSLGLGCVAEGVEQPYQRDRLGAMGCRSFQGWLFSPAVSAEEASALLPRIVSIDGAQASQRVPR